MAKRKARQETLPSMEDRAIKALEDLAIEYDGIKKARMELTTQEIDLKKRVRQEMKKRNKVYYAYDNVEIELIPPSGEDDVKVRIKKQKDSETEDEAEAEE